MIDHSRPGWRFGAIALFSLSMALSAIAQEPTEAATRERVETARAELQEWVETRRVISKEKRDWALGREILDERIGLVQREIDSLHSRIGDAEKSISEADKKREELVQENEQLKRASSALGEIVVTLEERTRSLLKRLPDPISERVKPLALRVPAADSETKLSLGERFQNVVGILNEIDKFNREITVTSEVRTLSDGTSAEVTALYLGIGQAYYVTANGDAAGIGTATPEGWTWVPANGAAPSIQKAIAILKNEQMAEFVRLPVRIQ